MVVSEMQAAVDIACEMWMLRKGLSVYHVRRCISAPAKVHHGW